MEFTKVSRTPNLKSANDWFRNLFFHLDCSAQITVITANTPFAATDTAIIRSSYRELFCKKGVLTNVAKFTRKHQKRDPDTNVFL